MAKKIEKEDLVIHVLNVGFGDNIIIEFPVDSQGKRSYGIVDCFNAEKTKKYIKKLQDKGNGYLRLKFVCATHPHYDHIAGINSILTDNKLVPHEFWDSGFRHKSKTYKTILETIAKTDKIKMVRVTSGIEWYFGKVRITALSPSVMLRNKYASYGVDMNNASIVLRIEHHKEDVLLTQSMEYVGKISKEFTRKAGKSVVVLSGDAEFDSWAHIVNEYPKIERTKENDPAITKMVNLLSCYVIKVAHHGSMHSTPLDVYEKMNPEVAIISTKQEISTKSITTGHLTRGLFPHQSTIVALQECDINILTTDGSYESQKKEDDTLRNPAMAHEGSIVIVIPPGGKPHWTKLKDKENEVKDPSDSID